jgi:hypothetical protein
MSIYRTLGVLLCACLCITAACQVNAMDVTIELERSVSQRDNQVGGPVSITQVQAVMTPYPYFTGAAGIQISDPQLTRRKILPLLSFRLQTGPVALKWAEEPLPSWGFGLFEPLVLSDRSAPIPHMSYRINYGKAEYA